MIRKYQQSDADQIIDIWFEASRVAHPFLRGDFIEAEKKRIREIYLPNTKTWVYEGEDRLDGFISMIGNEIGAIFVRPEYHKMGIGSQLIDFVSQNFEVLEVEVFEKNVIGRKFYRKYGFKHLKSSIHKETNEKVLRLKFSR